MPMTAEAGERIRKATQVMLIGVIKRAKMLASNGIDQIRIAKILNQEGYRTKSGLTWTQGNVNHLLRRYK